MFCTMFMNLNNTSSPGTTPGTLVRFSPQLRSSAWCVLRRHQARSWSDGMASAWSNSGNGWTWLSWMLSWISFSLACWLSRFQDWFR